MTVSRDLRPDVLRRVFGAFPTGVAAVCALVDGVPTGIAASSFTSVSLKPPMVSVCVAHSSTTWPRLRAAGRLGVSVLGSQQEAAARQLGSRRSDRFEGLPWRATPGDGVLLEGASASFECSLEREVPAGDHDIVLLRVLQVDADPGVPPLVFHASQFRRLEE